VDVPVKTFGLPQEFLPHGTRAEVLEEAGLTAQQIALRITEAVARRSSGEAPETQDPETQDPETQDAAPEGRPVE
jgi:1-deoxy-D-xylulose-5-phosphate synthase